MAEIEKARQEAAQPKMMMRRGDGTEVQLGPTEMIQLIQQQHQHIVTLTARIKELEDLVKLHQTLKSLPLPTANQPVFKVNGD